TEFSAHIVHSFGIECGNSSAFLLQCFNDVKCRCLSHIVCVGLKRKTPKREVFSFKIVSEELLDSRNEMKFLTLVHLHHGIKNSEFVFHVVCRFHQRLHILREAAATIANAWEKKSFSDAIIASDATANHVNVCTQQLTKLRDFVHE